MVAPQLTQPPSYAGTLDGKGLRFAVVIGRFNALIAERLLAGAQDVLLRHGVASDAIEVTWVPGAFEIPLAARRLARSGRYDALVCLGAVIRGSTPHFDYVAGQAARGIAQAAWDSDVPVAFGVLTCDTVDQALDRAGLKAGNKGCDAALVALEMARLWQVLPKAAAAAKTRGS